MRYVVRILISLLLPLLVAAPCVAQPGPETPWARGLAHYRAGSATEAVADLKRALAADSSEVRRYVVLASALLQANRSEEAIRVAERGLARFPNHASLRLAQGEALMKQERWEEALAAYRQVTARRDGGSSLPSHVSVDQVRAQQARLHRLVGRRHAQSEAYDAALHHLRTARELGANEAAVASDIAALHLKRKDWSAANRAAKRGLEDDPRNVRLLRIRSQALTKLEKTDAILPVLRTLREQAPTDVNVGIAYGRALMANGKSEEAQPVFEHLLEEHPREKKIYDALASTYQRRLKYDHLLKVLERKQRHFPDDQSLAMRIARVHEQMKDYEAARAMYDSAQALAGPGDVSPMLARARTFVDQDRIEAAVTEYRKILDRAPSNVRALRAVGRLYERQNAWTEALRAYQILRDVEEQQAYASYRIGQVYEEMDRTSDAFEAYRTAIEQGARHPLPYYRYAVLLKERPNRDPTTDPFAAAKQAVRTSVRALENLRDEQRKRVQNTSIRSAARTEDEAARTQERFQTVVDVAENAMGFFARAYPRSNTTPVVTDLVDPASDGGIPHYLLGLYYREAGPASKADYHLRRAVRVQSKLRPAHVALGAVHEAQGAHQKAIRAYERARSLDEDAEDAYRALLRLYESTGRLDSLIRRWQARYRSSPENAVLRAHLIQALHKAGRYEEARALAPADSASSTPR